MFRDDPTENNGTVPAPHSQLPVWQPPHKSAEGDGALRRITQPSAPTPSLPIQPTDDTLVHRPPAQQSTKAGAAVDNGVARQTDVVRRVSPPAVSPPPQLARPASDIVVRRDPPPQPIRPHDEVAVRRVAPPTRLHTYGDVSIEEQYRQVFVSLKPSAPVDPLVIGITSAIRGEGRTTVAVGLAKTLASDLDVPVLLVDGDLEQPSLATYFGVSQSPGLCDVLYEDHQFSDVVHEVAENLSLLTTGDAGLDVARFLRQLSTSDLFHTTPALTGVIIVDLPPLVNYSYSALAARIADVSVMVVRAGVTTIDLFNEAVARLDDRPPQGVIFNGAYSSLPRWWRKRGGI